MNAGVSRSEAARRADVTAQTLRRWEQEGLVPLARDAGRTPAAIAQARVVAGMCERGHSVAEIREATELYVARAGDDDG
jgi:adenylate cyclase